MTTDENGDYKSAYTYGLDRISVDTLGINDDKYTPLYYQYNGRGDVTGLINSLDEVKAKYRYDAFGVPKPGVKLDTDANGFINPYGYNGEDYDMYSGLQYLRARYYEPETGRFLTRDSYLGNVMSQLTLNRYDYTSNNPLMYIDPSGHSISNTVNGKDTPDERHESHAREGIVMAEEMGGKVQNLQVGSSGEEVRQLQQQLIYLGDLAPGEADGDFGTKTYNAVRKFQTEQDIGIDGIVGKQTLIQLQTAINMKRDDETANFIAKNNPGSSIEDKVAERAGETDGKVCGGGNLRTGKTNSATPIALVGAGGVDVAIPSAGAGSAVAGTGIAISPAAPIAVLTTVLSLLWPAEAVGQTPAEEEAAIKAHDEKQNNESNPKVKEPASPGSLQKQVEKGQAPREVDRVDKPHVPGQKPHVHFEDGTSLNNDGTTHDVHKGTPDPSNKIIDWLNKNGWKAGK